MSCINNVTAKDDCPQLPYTILCRALLCPLAMSNGESKYFRISVLQSCSSSYHIYLSLHNLQPKLSKQKKNSIWLKAGIIVLIDVTRMCTEVYSRSDWATTLTPEQGSPRSGYTVFKWTVECYYISKLMFSAGSHVKFFEGQNWSTLAQKIEKSLPQSDHGVKEWKVLLMLR